MRVMFILFLILNWQATAVEIKGKIQASLVKANELESWLDKGTGVVRYDENQLTIQQAFLQVRKDLLPELDIVADLSYYPDGDQHLGLTQFQLRYKPLMAGELKWRMRAGFFYPKMSLENVDLGWLSPYTYNQSAINSWIGEELRTAGLEFTLYSPGRSRRSPWSWELHAAVFKGNDPLGSVISWRGFATHDRQSLHHERLEFAAYPSVVDRDVLWHPSWIEPFREIDGKAGFYVGAHLEHRSHTKLRYYYYDNLADPLAVNEQRLYAWRTKFHSIAFQHNFDSQTRIISQFMRGNTEMGYRFVFVDFDSLYVMLSRTWGQNRLSVRYDYFDVDEDDHIPQDQNNSDGYAVTVSWRYDYDKHWQFGLEHHINENTAENRIQFNQPLKASQHQSLFVVQYSW